MAIVLDRELRCQPFQHSHHVLDGKTLAVQRSSAKRDLGLDGPGKLAPGCRVNRPCAFPSSKCRFNAFSLNIVILGFRWSRLRLWGWQNWSPHQNKNIVNIRSIPRTWKNSQHFLPTIQDMRSDPYIYSIEILFPAQAGNKSSASQIGSAP